MITSNNELLRGYVEGYYGRLLAWPDRGRIVAELEKLGMNCFFYAPKEDAKHRFTWRESYSEQWRQAFRRFCADAGARGVTVIAGLAPGLDFNFNHLEGGPDFQILCDKARAHLTDGAAAISLLMDDIDEKFDSHSASFSSEGQAHAALGNALSDVLEQPVFVVPRVYANDIAKHSPGYLADFVTASFSNNPIFFSGSHIVAEKIKQTDFDAFANNRRNRVIVWDNLYANDYCPRRLFVGPWTGRDDATEILLNPTGLIETDLLLLNIMAACHGSDDKQSAWKSVMVEHNIPTAFFQVSRYFNLPPFDFADLAVNPIGSAMVNSTDLAPIMVALDRLQWQWKTALSREWYPFLMGLRHDLRFAAGQLSDITIQKTYTSALASALVGSLKLDRQV